MIWHSKVEFKSEVPKKGRIQNQVAVLPPRSKEAPSPIAEGVFPFEISGDCLCQLQLQVGVVKWTLFERQAKPFHERVTVTLRMSRQKNWYAAKLQFANHVFETDWREAKAASFAGSAWIEIDDSASTVSHELKWWKQASPFPDENGKFTKVWIDP